ncbi:hypothetical protein GEV39_07615 [Pseudomonas sp. NY5710]|uniref:hypothetical protein n=1 Tax=Pseudomonas sp. NY5710 TaxID=2662033 RepID=UPI00156F8759|nr:hypothetical protein [Pseudomonas sp. NY5710]QKL01288.1 hypothetical protein GEV39_07615 [Pseudomonas sp. NY5710]
MPQYVVSYDLHQAGRDYERMKKGLASLGTDAKLLASVWLLDTNRTAVQVRDYLLDYCDGNDGIAIIEVSASWATIRVAAQGQQFLKKHRP